MLRRKAEAIALLQRLQELGRAAPGSGEGADAAAEVGLVETPEARSGSRDAAAARGEPRADDTDAPPRTERSPRRPRAPRKPRAEGGDVPGDPSEPKAAAE